MEENKKEENFEEVIEEVVEEATKKIEEVKDKASELGISKSKQKRLDQKKKVEEAKRKKVISDIVWTVIIVLFAAAIIAALIVSAVKKSNEIVSSNDYSAELTEDGFIEGVTASSCVTLPDYKSLEVPYSEIEYTDEKIDADLQTALENHKVLNSEEGTIKDQDQVNIDFVGTVDGEEFEGGSTNGNGYDLAIGSGSFVDDFEQQLIGANVGDEVTVDVTFPEDYASEDLAGKDAQFAVTVNGIYELAELDDDFICAYYGDYASTVEEYRQHLKESQEDLNLESYITTYLNDNTTVTKYPSKYLKKLKCTQKYDDEQMYEYMNQMYMQYTGQGYGSFEEYQGMTMEEYIAGLDETCKEQEKTALINQAILESEGVSADAEEYKADLVDRVGDDSAFTTIEEQKGHAFAMTSVIAAKAMDIVKGYVTIKK